MLTFPQPDGVTVQSWDSGFGRATDAFKPGQVPGASTGGGGSGNRRPDRLGGRRL